MTEPTARQQEIVSLARTRGRVSVDDLALKFDVTPQTIRKDLNELCERRKLSRVHGGAVIASSVENLGYEARRGIAAREKRSIGLAAARLIPDNSSLFLNLGTTTEEVARALTGHQGLLVITNNLNIATLLYANPNIEVIVAGGPVRGSDGGVVGGAAVDFIRQFKVDHAIIGTSAIDEDGALLDFDFREVRVSQAILGNARKAVLVADRLKFERNAPIRVAHLSQVNVFVTDRLASPPVAEICGTHGVQVIETGRDEQDGDAERS